MRRSVISMCSILLLAACETTGGSATLSGARPDTAEVKPGTTLPFGEIARVCGLSNEAQGTPVATESGFTLYDTAPTSTAPRTQYVTGFDDGCARQVTGALSLFGATATHEAKRYSESEGYTVTDIAYEEVKGQICGVAAGTPCGAKAERLAANTVFLTLYRSFGASGRYADVLLHDGRVVAMDVNG